MKYQNYLHYKLPISTNPLDYGKLLEQFDNKYIIQLSTSNVIIIKEYDNDNYIKFFRRGELIFEFKDSKISEDTFIRTILDQKYTFKNNKLISTEILSLEGYTQIYKDTNAVLLSPVSPLNYKNIIKYLENTNIYKKAELFILFELFLILLVYIIFIVIIPDDIINTSLAGISTHNIIKLRKTGSRNIWDIFIINFGNKVFTRSLFESKFNQFWINIQSNFDKNNHLFVLFKIKYVNNEYVTIGKLQKLNLEDKNWYIDFIIENMDFKSEYYNETQIDSIIFSYGFKKGIIISKDKINLNMKFLLINNMKLPISLNPLDFGRLIDQNKIDSCINYILQDDKGQTIKFSKFEDYNEVEYFKKGISLIKFKDEIISENKFMRIINNKKYYFENGTQVLFTNEIKTKFIKKLKATKILKNNFITLDIETYIKDSILIVYCISIFDGKSKNSFFLNDFKNPEELIITALKSIMIRKYNKTNVYIHNMGKFDIIFLLKYLVKLGKIKPIIHNDRFISIKFNYGKNNEYQIEFRDSLLILLQSLAKLCKSFKVENSKSIFPYLFVNENNLDYIGQVPDFKYFDKISKNEYNEYKSNFNNNWNLKNETKKYCELDCISLYQVIFKFTEMIFDLFNKNVHHHPTLPSLAYGIFRSKFMSEENIPQLSGKIADEIRKGYTGGAVDMYIPKSKPGIKIKCLDVNSLYPSQMESKLMPVGFPIYFSGNIRTIDKDAFGFFFCEIIAPDNIKHPIIQTHVKTNNGIRTISPIGTWKDMIFSSEMDNAIKYGYKFNIFWGYTFKKENIFKNYVNFLYDLRSQYPSNDPMNFIAKILLNSLYGRFGMDDNFPNIDIIPKDYYPDFENKFFDNIIETIDLGDFKLIKYEAIEEVVNDNTHNISISIAAAITAYSRIHMSQFKNNPDINLYYTDTDSIYTDSDIDSSFIHEKQLGKLKVENISEDVIFLGPKMYCLNTIDQGFKFKIKGLKSTAKLSLRDFKNLLFKNFKIEKSHTKWYRNLDQGKITLLEQVYTIKTTENKRKLIYDNNAKLIGTKAFKLDNGILIK
jgi:DNA polymerase type B, organellar and viral